MAVARVAWFDGWVAFSETRRLSGPVSVESSMEILWKGRRFRAAGGVAVWAVERNIGADVRDPQTVEDRIAEAGQAAGLS